jgi:hypothetical protein
MLEACSQVRIVRLPETRNDIVHTWLRALWRHVEPNRSSKSKPTFISYALWSVKEHLRVTELDLWEATVVIVPWELECTSAKEFDGRVFARIVYRVVISCRVVITVVWRCNNIACDLFEVVKRLPPLFLDFLASSSRVGRGKWTSSIVTSFLGKVSKQGCDLLLANIIDT